jgi:hypothetical protein
MKNEGERKENHPSAQKEVLEYPNITEIPNDLHVFLFQKFDKTRNEEAIKDKFGNIWTLEHFEHKDVRIINLFNELTYKTLQARIVNDSSRIIREIQRDKNENYIKWSYPAIKDENGEWTIQSLDQNPNVQQL